VKFTEQVVSHKGSILRAEILSTSTSLQENPQGTKQLNYEIVNNLDMYGGDIRNFTFRTREDAIRKAIELVGDDSTKCVTICKRYRTFDAYFKEIMSCQPMDYELYDNDGICQTLFLKTS
jgi:hypothetical protein